MKKKLVLILGLTLSLTVFAEPKGGGDVGSVVLVDQVMYGLKCKIKKGTVKFSGVENNEAFRKFSAISGLSIFSQINLRSLKRLDPNSDSLAFEKVKTLVSIVSSDSSDLMFPATQETKIYDRLGKTELKTDDDIGDDGFINRYSHAYAAANNGSSESLAVTYNEFQITDHWKFKSAQVRYEYRSPADSPMKKDGVMTADLTCENR